MKKCKCGKQPQLVESTIKRENADYGSFYYECSCGRRAASGSCSMDGKQYTIGYGTKDRAFDAWENRN